MELGEKLRLVRQEMDLSQRQLCGDVITRNMLSQIEHGTAKPSMETLRYLAMKLHKPVSYFLEEDVVVSPNQELMAQARIKWEEGSFGELWLMLKNFRQPDPMLEWQWRCLSVAAAMEAAKAALAEGKDLYARQLLEEVADLDPGIPGLQRHRLLLLASVPGADLLTIVRQLPSLDGELMIRAEAAMMDGDPEQAGALLRSVEDKTGGKWNLLQGKLLMRQKEYVQAAKHLQKAEPELGTVCIPLLETCFRELGDFQKAYEYACKQR